MSHLQVLQTHMKKEIEANRSSLTAYDLVKTRGMRRISICLIVVWSDNMPLSPTSQMFFIYLQHICQNSNHISYYVFYLPDTTSLCQCVISSCLFFLSQVFHEFCILWFSDGFAKVWGESAKHIPKYVQPIQGNST